MSCPIILWKPIPANGSDDAGNKIVKTTLAPPVRPALRYKPCDIERPRRLSRVPRLASFCIRALSGYPDQLHQLGSTRLYFDHKKGGTDSVLRAVLPKWQTVDFSLLEVDPRLWATVIQIYRNPPDMLSSYPCQLSDPHVPLLNRIPATPDFTLLTVLDLSESRQLTDKNVLSLKVLHNLTALDIRRCLSVTARGITALSRTLTFNEFGEKRGLWALRILRMRWCLNVDGSVFDCLHNFPLLSVVDLRETSCRPKDIRGPFFSVGYEHIFEYSLEDAVYHLSDTHKNMFPNETPFILSLQDSPGSIRVDPLSSSSSATSMLSRHETFFVLPPSRGATFSGRRMTGPIRFGNIHTNEFKKKQAEREAYLRARQGEDEYHNDASADDDYDFDEDSEAFTCQSEDTGAQRLFFTLQESTERQERGLHTDAPTRPLSDVSSLSALLGPGSERRNEAHATAPVDTFYQQRPYVSPPRQRNVFRESSYELALLRVPPAWQKLSAITAESQLVGRKNGPTDKQVRSGEANLMVKRKREAPMQALQSELVKRRKPLSLAGNLGDTVVNDHEFSPPPSLTSTVCDAKEILDRQRPALQPISNLRPPPRCSFAAPPRMKLDSVLKSTKDSSSKPPARFTAVAAQGTLKPGNMNLSEGFRVQTRKLPVSPLTGFSIKMPTSKGSNNEFTFLKRPTSKRDSTSSSNPRDKGKSTNGASVAESGGFDWNRWMKS